MWSNVISNTYVKGGFKLWGNGNIWMGWVEIESFSQVLISLDVDN